MLRNGCALHPLLSDRIVCCIIRIYSRLVAMHCVFFVLMFTLCLSPPGDKYRGDGEMRTQCTYPSLLPVVLEKYSLVKWPFNPEGGSTTSCQTGLIWTLASLNPVCLCEHVEITGVKFKRREVKIRFNNQWKVDLHGNVNEVVSPLIWMEIFCF